MTDVALGLCIPPQVGAWANGNGYYRVTLPQRRMYIHVLAFIEKYGPVPRGMVLDHLCRNRWCRNADHLEPVTNTENILRGESPPARNARKTRCPNGHEYRVTRDGYRRCRTCDYRRRVASGEVGGKPAPSKRTECPQGHPFSDENTYLVRRSDGSVKQRACRECSRQRVRARRARQRGLA